MLLDFTNDPMMVQKHIIESDEDELGVKEVLLGQKSDGSVSEYDSTSSDEELLSQPSECDSRVKTTIVESSEISEPEHEIREVWSHNLYQEFMECGIPLSILLGTIYWTMVWSWTALKNPKKRGWRGNHIHHERKIICRKNLLC